MTSSRKVSYVERYISSGCWRLIASLPRKQCYQSSSKCKGTSTLSNTTGCVGKWFLLFYRHGVCSEVLLTLGSMYAMPHKRASNVQSDRLWSIINTIANMDGMNLSKVCEKAGIAKRGSPYETVRYWHTGRKNPRKPKDEYQQSLPKRYRQLLFRLVRSNPRYREEYLKPLPPGEAWLDVQEQLTWLEDTLNVDLRFEKSQGLWTDAQDVLADLEAREKPGH
jgi:hypothetical protein